MIKNDLLNNNLRLGPGKKRRLPEIVRDQIIADMLSANIRPGDNYATEDQLTKRFGVSRNTIRKAMAELEEAGFLIRRQRVGAIVTAKACTGINNDLENNLSSQPNTSRNKIILVLPRWEAGTGNYFSNVVLRELNCTKNGKARINVEIRLFDDPLDDLDNNTQAILVVDPIPSLTPTLATWSKRGKEIIVIGPSTSLFMVSNIKFSIFQAAYDSVKFLFERGHRNIGIVNHELIHDTFRQWWLCYLKAHQDLNLPIHPKAVMQNINTDEECAKNIGDITAWICTYKSAVDYIGQACQKAGLRIPENVAIIGGDDPGDVVVSTIGCKVSVIRPDYIALSKTIRGVLDGKIKIDRGSTFESPMKWIIRESTG